MGVSRIYNLHIIGILAPETFKIAKKKNMMQNVILSFYFPIVILLPLHPILEYFRILNPPHHICLY